MRWPDRREMAQSCSNPQRFPTNRSLTVVNVLVPPFEAVPSNGRNCRSTRDDASHLCRPRWRPYALELSTSPPYKTLRYLKSGQVLARLPGRQYDTATQNWGFAGIGPGAACPNLRHCALTWPKADHLKPRVSDHARFDQIATGHVYATGVNVRRTFDCSSGMAPRSGG